MHEASASLKQALALPGAPMKLAWPTPGKSFECGRALSPWLNPGFD